MAKRKKRDVTQVLGSNINTRRMMEQIEEPVQPPAAPAPPPARKKKTSRRRKKLPGWFA